MIALHALIRRRACRGTPAPSADCENHRQQAIHLFVSAPRAGSASKQDARAEGSLCDGEGRRGSVVGVLSSAMHERTTRATALRDSLDSRYTPPPTARAGRFGSWPGRSDLFGRELATGRLDCRVALNIAPTTTRRSHSLLLGAYMAPPLAMSAPAPRCQQTGCVLLSREARGAGARSFSQTCCAHPFPQRAQLEAKLNHGCCTSDNDTDDVQR